MKKRIAVLAMFSMLTACINLQPLPESHKTITKTYEIKMRKDKIFDLSLEWIAKSFGSGKEVLELSNKATGKIIGNGMFTYDWGMTPRPAKYSMTIEVKDNRFRVSFDNIGILYNEISPQAITVMGEYEQIEPKLINVADSLFEYLQRDHSKSDW